MDNQTIIVKKIKKGGHGHHGGAWKVAFADFVTAMMAFFLLLWLLAAARPEQQAAIAAYFIDPLQHEEARKAADSMIDHGGQLNTIKGQDGQDFRHGSGGDPADANSRELDPETMERDQAKQQAEAAQEQKKLESLMDEIKEKIETSEALKPYKDQLLLDITGEGLRIQIVDKDNRPMFDSGSSSLKFYTKEIMNELAKVIQKVPNKVSLTGHTDAVPFYGYDEQEGWTNWELSTARANASRRQLIEGGLGMGKVAKVVGLAETLPFDQKDPFAPINRRIAIIVMNKAAERALIQDANKLSAVLEKAEDITTMPQADAEAETRTLQGSIASQMENDSGQDAPPEEKPLSPTEKAAQLREERRKRLSELEKQAPVKEEPKGEQSEHIQVVKPIAPIQFANPIRDPAEGGP
jgi:chemotaxis protein MotB